MIFTYENNSKPASSDELLGEPYSGPHPDFLDELLGERVGDDGEGECDE